MIPCAPWFNGSCVSSRAALFGPALSRQRAGSPSLVLRAVHSCRRTIDRRHGCHVLETMGGRGLLAFDGGGIFPSWLSPLVGGPETRP